MGGVASCFSVSSEHPSPQKPRAPRRSATRREPAAASGRRRELPRSAEEALIHEQALAAAAAIVLQRRDGGGAGALAFDRSASVRHFGSAEIKAAAAAALQRSASSRPRSIAESVVPPHQLVKLDFNMDELETKCIVLVHGGGFGAWCWYKTIALLEDGGFTVSAIDLSGSGIHSSDSNKISSISEYVQPLTTFLEALNDTEKVILVGHDIGGACISYAMEMFPKKVAKAVFICATMLNSGQSIFDILSQKVDNDLLHAAQEFVYANGMDQPPTAINLSKAHLKELLLNQSPAKDVSLASVSMRTIPFAPIVEKLTLTENYGTVRRFYVETTDDNAIPLPLQQSMCESNPPEHVFRLKGSDHSPFFSKPQALHKILVEIACMSPLHAV